MAIKIIFARHHQSKLIRNQSHRHARFSLKESSANPSPDDLASAKLATPNTQGN
jgi:hypothetical protein